MKRRWPRWVPPREMVDRDERARKWVNGQPGGPENPLGARFHRQMAAIVTGHADLGIAPQPFASIGHCPIRLAQMHAIRPKPLCQTDHGDGTTPRVR